MSRPVGIRVSITISPLDHVAGDVPGLLGNFVFDLLQMLYPRQLSSKANVAVIELVTQVMEQRAVHDGALHVDLAVDGDVLRISVASPDMTAEYRVTVTSPAHDPKNLLAEEVSRRRNERQPGGLGLARLTGAKKKPKKRGGGGSTPPPPPLS